MSFTSESLMGEYESVRHLLNNPDPDLRREAAGRLEGCVPEEVLPLLLGLLHDPDEGVAAAAADGLAALNEPNAVKALLAAYNTHARRWPTDLFPGTRLPAFWRAVGKLMTPAVAREVLREGILSDQLEAIRVLATDRSPDTVEALCGVLKSRIDIVVLHATNALREFAQPRVVETLVSALRHHLEAHGDAPWDVTIEPPPYIILRFLKHLTGQDFKSRVESWEWWMAHTPRSEWVRHNYSTEPI